MWLMSLQQPINKYLVKLIIFGDISACKVYIVKFIVSLTLLMGLVVPEIWESTSIGPWLQQFGIYTIARSIFGNWKIH